MSRIYRRTIVVDVQVDADGWDEMHGSLDVAGRQAWFDEYVDDRAADAFSRVDRLDGKVQVNPVPYEPPLASGAAKTRPYRLQAQLQELTQAQVTALAFLLACGGIADPYPQSLGPQMRKLAELGYAEGGYGKPVKLTTEGRELIESRYTFFECLAIVEQWQAANARIGRRVSGLKPVESKVLSKLLSLEEGS